MQLLKNDKGSVTLELGLFIALVCALVFGFMTIMNGVKISIALQTAAREGAREYAATNNAALGQAKANSELTALGVGEATAIPSVEGEDRSMTLQKNYTFTIPLFGSYSKTLKGYCTFYKEPVIPEGS